MSRTKPILAGTAAFGTAAMLLTGCTPSPQENISEACVAAQAFAGALKGFRDTLAPGATVEEVQAARDELRNTRDDLVNAAEDVAQDRADALATAFDELDTAVEDVPDDATLTQAVDSLRNEAADVQNAHSDLRSELNC